MKVSNVMYDFNASKIINVRIDFWQKEERQEQKKSPNIKTATPSGLVIDYVTGAPRREKTPHFMSTLHMPTSTPLRS